MIKTAAVAITNSLVYEDSYEILNLQKFSPIKTFPATHYLTHLSVNYHSI